MKTSRMTIDVHSPGHAPAGRLNAQRVDATTEAELSEQQRADEAEAAQYAGKYARRVRRRLGLSQVQFASQIEVSLETIRNWEQGKRSPTGPAKALLKVLDKAPEAALAALAQKTPQH